MAYKFQLGAYTASGSLKQEGAFECETSITVGGAALTEAELEKLDGITNGTAAANKAVVLDGSKNIATIGTIGCGAITSTGASSFGSLEPSSDDGGALGSANKNWSDLYLADGAVVNFGDDQEITLTHTADQGLTLGSSASDAPMFIIKNTNADSEGATFSFQKDSASPADDDEIGNIEFYGDDDGGNVTMYAQIQVTSPDVSNTSEDGAISVSTMIGGSSVEILDINKSAASTITVKDGAYDFNIASHDGTNGLKLGGTLVQASAAAINQLSSGAVTTVTSLLATDIKIGEDDQTKIDFEDANKINFYANNAKELVLEENKLTPGTNDGIALGDSSLGFSDLYLADAATIQIGNDQDVTLTGADDSLTISSAASDFQLIMMGSSAGSEGIELVMHRSSSSPADNDVVGAVGFYGYDDGGGQTQFGGIEVVAADVSAGQEQGTMELKVAEYDGTATTGLKILGGSTNGVVDVQIGAGSTSMTTIAGDLQVNGTTTSINSTTIEISSSFTFEGPADAHETTLHAGGDGTGAAPQADSTLYLPALTAGSYYIPALADQASQASAAVTAAEFALLDGGSSVGTTALASGDGFLHNDGGTMKHTQIDKIADFFAGDALEASSGVLAVAVDNSSIEINSDAIRVKASGITNAMLAGSIADSKLNTITTAGKVGLAALEIDGGTDIGEALVDADLFIVDNGAGGTNRKCAMSRLKTYIGAGTLSVTSGSNAATLAAGVNYFGAHGGAISATLPGSSAPSVGDSVKIKAGSDCSSTNTLTVNVYANHTIDGQSSIVLESPYAAVECVYVVSGSWRVF